MTKLLVRSYLTSMKTEAIIAPLKAAEAELRQHGVVHVALFGSVARGEANSNSDIDIMVEISPGFPMSVYQYVGLVNQIKDMFETPVDVSNRASLKAHVRPSAERDAVYAF